MRWRTEKEVISGKGQFSCGARGCSESRGLATFEVPFGYEEAGEKKHALVKVGLCSLMAPSHCCAHRVKTLSHHLHDARNNSLILSTCVIKGEPQGL